ncbi:low molecular weight protein-tyrosine-phosphatase [Bacillus norwichensis]|uniref:protein-tyrosine-phosphatase n=1 Tax=Bacillus norwichensis TaxID=2762217 RepID=A0ABR8VIW2_9BACI|nr:low molecular weight protein-tyrosine-phosphatase [Bacillus norwichensis]MBD8004684.1 low molecular weight phosphotyrosine protein phosphatase [Bacillus norwichensis]
MVKVLFVCLGNICRSPMAEAIMRDLIEKEDLSKNISVDSAGTGSWHIGEPPHKGTLKKLEEYDVNTKGLIARQLSSKDFDEYDYIVGMDESNIRNISKITGQSNDPKIIRLLDLTDAKKDVPDPYYTGDFQETYDLISEGCQVLLERIKVNM